MELTALNTLDIVLTAIYFVGLISLIGALIVRLSILPLFVSSNDLILLRWKKFLVICLGTVTCALMGLFVTRSLSMNDDTFTALLDLFAAILFHTHFGLIEWIRFATLIIFWSITFYNLKENFIRHKLMIWLMLFLTFILALTTSSISHAADQGTYTLRIFIDCLHIISAAGWGGSIIAIVVCLFPFYRLLLKSPLIFTEVINRLSFISAISLVLVIFSGIYNAYWSLGTFTAFLTTETGIILIIKISLVALLASIGAFNRFILIPRIKHWANFNELTSAISLIKVTIIIDAVLVILILIMAAILIHATPPTMLAPANSPTNTSNMQI